MPQPPRPNLAHTLPPLMTAGDVAAVLGVDPRTVTRHDADLRPFRTLGGHRRYRRSAVALVAGRPAHARWTR